MADYINKALIVQREPWYKNQTFLWILKSTAINFVLPFFNGVMLGFGEILANELVFKYGWFGFSRVSSPATALGLGPGIPPAATQEYKNTLKAENNRLEKLRTE
ncbi:outer membrane protein TOM13-domain-containing protein [Circinella umbellata]|nr:outer membrane protein TOM13-domain-containing protein [Circinella umbellata]